MIDLTTLPSRLPPLLSRANPVHIQRVGTKHAGSLCEAGQAAIHHVRPWMGTGLCPVTPAAARQCIDTFQQQRTSGYGIAYLLLQEQMCLGMGLINYIHPTHKTANLGYWIRPEACGQGLAIGLCQSLQKLAFTQMGLERLELLIEPNNKASLRVAAKLGAEKEGLCRRRIFGRDALLYSLLA